MFTDPRTHPTPRAGSRAARTSTAPEALTELHRLCREGRLYDIERWIQGGHPLQLAAGALPGRTRVSSALEIALEQRNHALVLLLLCNGYDPNLESICPLDVALRARRWDLVALLLEWGADPHRVDLTDLFDTHNSELLEHFRGMGVELTAGHALAEALGYHTSNKPLFGFAKRHRRDDPRIQFELDIALAHHAGKGNAKGVELCLWAGGDPHTPVPDLDYPEPGGDVAQGSDEEDGFSGLSAVYEACNGGYAEILERLGPDPIRDDFDELYRAARSSHVIEVLARHRPPQHATALIHGQLFWLTLSYDRWDSLEALKRLFAHGLRWESASPQEIADTRRYALKTSDHVFVDLMKLFAEGAHCSSEILRELARTPTMRARMKKVRFIPGSPHDRSIFDPVRPSRSREVLARFGVELPKPAVPTRRLPYCVRIGGPRSGAIEVKLDRAALFERVWSVPVEKLADEWGVSGRGLAKACGRLRIPVPPRGYWARVQAGQGARQPRLPRLPEGEAEEILVWARAECGTQS